MKYMQSCHVNNIKYHIIGVRHDTTSHSNNEDDMINWI